MSANAASVPPSGGSGLNKPITPAVPAVINGSSNSGAAADHARKGSVTISAAGPTGFATNGGPKAALKFGYESPAVAYSTPTPFIPGSQRIPSPAQPPSPIPVASASGGRPPTMSQDGTGMQFGSFGGDSDVCSPPLPLLPSTP